MGIQRIETKSGIRYRVRRTVNQINRSKVVSTEAEAREIDSRWAAEIQPARKVKPKELMAAFLRRRWVEQNPFLYFELEEAR